MTIDELLHKKLELNFKVLAGSAEKRAKAKRVEKMILWVINDVRLRKFILEFKQRDGTPAFAQTDKSRVWHLTQFVQANERGLFKTDYKWDVQLKFYFKKWSKVIGFTNSGSTIINTNTKFVNDNENTDVKMAINNIHEMCHIFGMTHSFKRSYLWPDTAPYAIANFAGWLIENFYEKAEADTVDIVVPHVIPEQDIKKPTLWGRFKMWFRRLF